MEWKLVLIACSVFAAGAPSDNKDISADGGKHRDLRSDFRRLRREGAEGQQSFVEGLEEMAKKINSVGDRVDNLDTKLRLETERLETKLDFLDTKIFREVIPSQRSAIPSQRVRLSAFGALGRSYGRVEVWHQGEWGTVCRRGLVRFPRADSDGNLLRSSILPNGENTAGVICRSLGFDKGEPMFTEYSRGGRYMGAGTIWLDGVECKGDEKSLFDCNLNWPANMRCGHAADFSVECSYLSEDDE